LLQLGGEPRALVRHDDELHRDQEHPRLEQHVGGEALLEEGRHEEDEGYQDHDERATVDVVADASGHGSSSWAVWKPSRRRAAYWNSRVAARRPQSSLHAGSRQRSLGGGITGPASASRCHRSSGSSFRMPRPPASRRARSVAISPTSAQYVLAWFTASMVASRSPAVFIQAASCRSSRAARIWVPTSATVRCTSGWWLIGSIEGRWVLVRAISVMYSKAASPMPR